MEDTEDTCRRRRGLGGGGPGNEAGQHQLAVGRRKGSAPQLNGGGGLVLRGVAHGDLSGANLLKSGTDGAQGEFRSVAEAWRGREPERSSSTAFSECSGAVFGYGCALPDRWNRVNP
jgi:hypothetical protein